MIFEFFLRMVTLEEQVQIEINVLEENLGDIMVKSSGDRDLKIGRFGKVGVPVLALDEWQSYLKMRVRKPIVTTRPKLHSEFYTMIEYTVTLDSKNEVEHELIVSADGPRLINGANSTNVADRVIMGKFEIRLEELGYSRRAESKEIAYAKQIKLKQ